jgi:hypothetical protein
VFNLKILKINTKNIILHLILYGSEIRLFLDEELEYLRLRAGRANCWGEYISTHESNRRVNEIRHFNKELYELNYSPNRLIRAIKSKGMKQT